MHFKTILLTLSAIGLAAVRSAPVEIEDDVQPLSLSFNFTQFQHFCAFKGVFGIKEKRFSSHQKQSTTNQNNAF
jgi:hypothetical protein